MHAKRPFLFIDVPDGEEKQSGRSTVNDAEADVVSQFLDLAVDYFKENDGQNGLPK